MTTSYYIENLKALFFFYHKISVCLLKNYSTLTYSFAGKCVLYSMLTYYRLKLKATGHLGWPWYKATLS